MRTIVMFGVGLAMVVASLTGPAIAQNTLPPPVPEGYRASSPYGPRILRGEFQFHPAVDFPAIKDVDPVLAVAGGVVETIDQDGQFDWYIAIRGTPRFAYLHIFNNDPVRSPRFLSVSQVGGQRVTLQQVKNRSTGATCKAIVFWQDDTNASRGLTPIACEGVLVGGIALTSRVAVGEVIGPVGDSGSARGHPHVHLTANYKVDNPLYYVAHPTGDFGITIENQAPNTTLTAAQSPLLIKALIDSCPSVATVCAQAGDLNKVEFFVAPQATPTERTRLVIFGYDGRPDETGSGENLNQSSGSNTGIIPRAPYKHEFFFQWPFASLVPGNYILSVDATNIFNQTSTKAVAVQIATGPPVLLGAAIFSDCPLDFPNDPDFIPGDVLNVVSTTPTVIPVVHSQPHCFVNVTAVIQKLSDSSWTFTFQGLLTGVARASLRVGNVDLGSAPHNVACSVVGGGHVIFNPATDPVGCNLSSPTFAGSILLDRLDLGGEAVVFDVHVPTTFVYQFQMQID